MVPDLLEEELYLVPYACRRLHVPDNYAQLLANHPRGGPALASVATEVLYGPPELPLDAPRSRGAWSAFLSHVGPHDPHGHIPYLGDWPKRYARPRVTIAGQAYDAVTLLRMHYGLPDEGDSWARLCASTRCIAPAHYRAQAAAPPRVGRTSTYLEAWEWKHPKLFATHRPTSWRYDDRDITVALCTWGHVLTVYGPRSSYCAECFKLAKEYKKDRARYVEHLNWPGATPEDDQNVTEFLSTRLHAREIAHAEEERRIAIERERMTEWSGPTLSDMILAEQAAATHVD